jgi:transcription elongation GreA/GreB family factor
MLETAERSRNDAIEESKHHKGAMESRYDTFKEEAQYLMVAQDLRIAELHSTVSLLSSQLSRLDVVCVRAGAFVLVGLEDESGEQAFYLILPTGGGVTCIVGEMKVTTINEASPLAEAIKGLAQDEEAELVVAGKKKTFAIVSIS